VTSPPEVSRRKIANKNAPGGKKKKKEKSPNRTKGAQQLKSMRAAPLPKNANHGGRGTNEIGENRGGGHFCTSETPGRKKKQSQNLGQKETRGHGMMAKQKAKTTPIAATGNFAVGTKICNHPGKGFM